MRQALVIGIVIAFLMPAIPAAPTLDDNDAGSGTDAGDSMESAFPIVPGTYSGRLTLGVDGADWYSFYAEAGQGVTFAGADPLSQKPSFTVVDPLGYSVGAHSVATATGTWHVRVTTPLVTSGPVEEYAFTFRVIDRIAQNDAGSGRDAGRYDAIAISDGTTEGMMDEFDTSDYYTFEGAAGETLRVTFVKSGSAVLQLRDPSGGYMYGSGYASDQVFVLGATGTFSAVVNSYCATCAPVFYTIGLERPIPPANSERANAWVVQEGTTFEGSSFGATTEANESFPCGSTRTVWFRFVASDSGLITIGTANSKFTTVVAVYEADESSEITCSSLGFRPEITFTTVAGQAYDIQLGGVRDDMGDYELTLSAIRSRDVDLVVDSVGISSTLYEGKTVDIWARFYNIGADATETPVTVDVRLDGVSVHRELRDAGLGGGRAGEIYVGIPHVVAGTHTFEVLIDVDDNQTETNESNNLLSVTRTVAAPALISVKVLNLQRVPLRTEAGDVVHPIGPFEATVGECNRGTAAVETSVSRFYVVGGNGSNTGSGSVSLPLHSASGLGAGECLTYPIRFDAPGAIGDFRFQVSNSVSNGFTWAESTDEAHGFNHIEGHGGIILRDGVRPAS